MTGDDCFTRAGIVCDGSREACLFWLCVGRDVDKEARPDGLRIPDGIWGLPDVDEVDPETSDGVRLRSAKTGARRRLPASSLTVLLLLCSADPDFLDAPILFSLRFSAPCGTLELDTFRAPLKAAGILAVSFGLVAGLLASLEPLEGTGIDRWVIEGIKVGPFRTGNRVALLSRDNPSAWVPAWGGCNERALGVAMSGNYFVSPQRCWWWLVRDEASGVDVRNEVY